MMTGKVCVGGLGQGRECRVRAACVCGGLVDLCLTQLCLCVFVPCARACVCASRERAGEVQRERSKLFLPHPSSALRFLSLALFHPTHATPPWARPRHGKGRQQSRPGPHIKAGGGVCRASRAPRATSTQTKPRSRAAPRSASPGRGWVGWGSPAWGSAWRRRPWGGLSSHPCTRRARSDGKRVRIPLAGRPFERGGRRPVSRERGGIGSPSASPCSPRRVLTDALPSPPAHSLHVQATVLGYRR